MAVSWDAQQTISSVLEAYQALFKAESPAQGVDAALRGIGTAINVDRVYVFQMHRSETGEELASQRYEWSATDAEPQIDNPDLQDIPMVAAGYGRWIRELSAFRPIVGLISEFPEEEHPLLEPQDIRSILVLPIFVNDAFWGFVGFDDCHRPRIWTSAEVDVLLTTAIAIGTVFGLETGAIAATAPTEEYLALVTRLFRTSTTMLSSTPLPQVLHRTHVRLRVLAQSFRFMLRHRAAEVIPLPAYLHDLRPLFAHVRFTGAVPATAETALAIDPIEIPFSRALDIAIMLAEVIAVVADLKQADIDGSILGVSLKRADERIELTITARDAAGVPVGHGTLLDPMAIELFRVLSERFRARISTDGFDGLLFRVSFAV